MEITVILGAPLVYVLDVRPMKPLFIPVIFLFLTAAVLADQGVVRSSSPMLELVTLREVPSYTVLNEPISAVSSSIPAGERMFIPMPYTVGKPPQTSITLPEPLLEPLVQAPLLPRQDRSPPPPIEEPMAPMEIFRGQARIEGSAGMLDIPLPLPGGPVSDGTIDQKIIDNSDPSDLDDDFLAGFSGQGTAPEPPSGTASDPVAYGVLVIATIITTFGFFYMAFVAYDYHQRWMHSLTAQNDRYIIGGAYDVDTEDLYGGSRSYSDGFGFSDSFALSDGFGLVRRPI